MSNILKVLFVFLIILTINANAQQIQLPNLHNVDVKAVVENDQTKIFYIYSYSIKNGADNNAGLDKFEIDVSRDSISTAILSDIGLQFVDTLIEKAYKRMYAEISNSIVPISFPSLPQYGNGALTIKKTAKLYAKVIKQGEEISGFKMSSRGLPGIRGFIAAPYYDAVNYYPNIDNVDDPYALIEKMERDRDSISFHGCTLGPIAPPKNFIATTWCDTLSSYTIQSRSLGWIKDQTTANKYLGYFASAKTSLGQNNITSVRTTLQQVLSDVNIDSTNNLTSEAYALIRYNTEYLLAKLSTPPPTYSLTVSTVGNGSVTLNPNQTKYDSASTVQLTASPQQGNELSGWSGNLTGKANPASIIMNANKSVTAIFTPSAVWTNDGPTTFDGTSTYVDGGKTPGSASNLTVAFYMTAHKLANMVPTDKLPTTGKAGWSVKMRSNGDLWFRIGSDKTKTDITKSGAYSANTKVHIACTFENGTAKIYVNGVLVTTKTKITYTVNNTTTNLRLGIPSVAAITEKFDGVLEQVKIYNQVLTAAQISSLAGK